MTSQLLCSEIFISGLSTERAFADTVLAVPGLAGVDWALGYDVDMPRRQVRATVLGAFESRAVYRAGEGCLLVRGNARLKDGVYTGAPAQLAPRAPDPDGDAVITPVNDALRAAMTAAFAEPEQAPYRHTRAIVVIHRGKIVGEQYAPGFGIDTPLKSWSVAKSATNALIGVLIRQGRLSTASISLPGWQDADDPRRQISLDMLLRHTSGLALAQTNSGFDPSTRMKFVESDMAGFAQSALPEAAPGTRWAYTDGHYMLLSRIVRDAAGGSADKVREFAARELFGPVGMRNVTMEFDATGTPLGSHSFYATARDWARLGLLYLNDGMVGDRRILPQDWVRYTLTPTLDTGYGAGFYLNHLEGNVPGWGVPWGMRDVPRDAFFARGYLGQYIVVVPSKNLVVAKFGTSQVKGDDIDGANRLVADVIAALEGRPAPAR